MSSEINIETGNQNKLELLDQYTAASEITSHVF